MNIVEAQREDAGTLTMIAFAAKRHWGYPDHWIREWEGVLTITPAYLMAHPTFAAVADEAIVGFGALQLTCSEAQLDHLWVLPTAMGKGVGRALFAHAEDFARRAGAVRISIVGDPHAEGFYRRMGASVHGRLPAPMAGDEQRYLPVFVKAL